MLTRYWGPFKQIYYHICSAHPGFDPSCDRCKCGTWHNVTLTLIDKQIYKYARPLWTYRHNRRNSKIRRDLKRWFPNLK